MIILQNRVLVASLLAWALAQLLKLLVHRILSGRLDLRMLASAGGMPSSHSAFVAALTAGVGFEYGLADPLFAACFVFSSIVMYDATGVRRAASHQARILNQIIEELFEGHPISQERLRELLGHTPIQVVFGALLGIGVSWAYMTQMQ